MSEQFDVILGGLDTEVDVTIADSTGVDPSVLLALRGEKGDKGDPGVPGQDGADGSDGQDGADGNGIASIDLTSTVDNVDTYTITYDDGSTETFEVTNGVDGQDGQDGTDGVDGVDGVSPIATVSKVGDTATITITDANGTTTANISDGTDGVDGTDGTDGTDGFSPIATVSKVGDTATISITDENGTTTATISDGTDGTDGRDGTDGTDGEDGVGIVSITKTATVGLVDTYTILYSDGTTSTFDVTNGQNGSGSVADVWVDGSSVLDGDTAKIDLTGKSDVGHTHTTSAITDFPTLSTVATSGNYNDLSNKPTIPTITDTYSGTSSNGMSGKAVKSAIDALDGTVSGTAGSGKTLTAFSQTDGKVSATFGNISITKSQVSDFPTIPTVNDATLTIQKNGTNVATFTANASSNVTANISVPTDTGDLTNGAGFITGYTETDPTFSASAASGISSSDISNWNGKLDAAGILNLFYPVGSYYETSDTSFDPNVSWGGTWSLETAGQVHISAGTGYAVAGALTNTTDGGATTVTLNSTQIPSHSHTPYNGSSYAFVETDKTATLSRASTSGTSNANFVKSTASLYRHETTGSTGGGQAHNNMQPYIIVNRWHRTA